MALKAGYRGIKKYIADKLNSLGDLDNLATDAELSEVAEEQEQLLEDTVGWVVEDIAKLYTYTGTNSHVDFTYSPTSVKLNGTATATGGVPTSATVPEDGILTLKAGKYKIASSNADILAEIIALDPSEVIITGNGTFTLTADRSAFIRAKAINGRTYENAVATFTLQRLSVEEELQILDTDKCDITVIGNVEDGATPSKSYAVGEHMIRGGKFCTVTSSVTTASTWTLNTNYVEGTIADNLAPLDIAITPPTGVTYNVHTRAYRIGNMGIMVFDETVASVSGGGNTQIGAIDSKYAPSIETVMATFDINTGKPILFYISHSGTSKGNVVLYAYEALTNVKIKAIYTWVIGT